VGEQSSRPKRQRASTVVSRMSTVLGVRLCGSSCSATPHVVFKAASKLLRRSARTGRECSYFLLLFDCGYRCLARERISARRGPWVSRARGVEWPQPVRDRQNQTRLSPQRIQGSDHSRIIPSRALLSPKVLTRCALHVLVPWKL
jgi:hypothetical protein